jgi:hypothetical protein
VVPDELKGIGATLIYGRVQGSTYVLKESGRSLNCPAPGRLSAENTESLQVVVLGNPVKDQVNIEVRGVEGQSLRFLMTDAQGRLVLERHIEKAAAVDRQSFGIASSPAGLLFLKVSTDGQSRTLKLVKP